MPWKMTTVGNWYCENAEQEACDHMGDWDVTDDGGFKCAKCGAEKDHPYDAEQTDNEF